MSEYPQPVPSHVNQPQDHRSVETFTYQSENGPITVPKFKRLMTFGFIRKNRAESEQDIMFLALEQYGDEQMLARVDTLGVNELEAFFTEWRVDSGVSVGESSPS